MKLYEILTTFDVYTLNRFRKYVASPFYNEKQAVLSLFDGLLPMLKQRLKEPSMELPTKWQLWKMAELNLEYNDTKLRRICSDLTQLTYSFLGVLESEKDEFSAFRYQTKALLTRRLEKHARTLLLEATTKLGLKYEQTADKLLSQFLLENQRDAWLVRDMRRTQETNVIIAATALDTFYLAERLRMCCDVLNYQNVLNMTIQLHGNEQVVALASHEKYSEIPIIKIYFSILQTLLEPDETAHFHTLKEVLATHITVVEPPQQREIYTFALNYGIRKINLGDASFYKELFELYQYVLQHKYIFDDGKLPAWDYKNIVTLGLRLQEFNWVERFLYDYNDRLPLDFKENALNYNLAKLNFANKKFGKVLDFLQVVTYQDIFYTLDSKVLLIKTYFELSEWTAIETQLESFRVFLVRQKTVSETTRIQYLNFLKFTKKLLQFPTAKKMAALVLQLAATPEVADRQWLRSKMETI